jgi:hypothetical protein
MRAAAILMATTTMAQRQIEESFKEGTKSPLNTNGLQLLP